MGFPASSFCMSCHASVKKDSPHIARLAAAAKENKPLPWVRVYKIPSYVFFSHRIHVETGATCQTCHGPVAERDVITKEVDISMGACMDCHRKNKASNDCKFCHDDLK
jgi:Fe-S cluster assembly scaffold protein SufB